ncbi:MAG: hypothetical protein QN143_07275 [Armatimonadota bacterium]|nr:hypothetical protein [Armatimonadota bacterium]
MPFTVKDFQSLLRLLERQPQWKDALRASLLGEEFLELPNLVRSLVQAQRATQRELRALAEAHRLTQQDLQGLAEQVRTLTDAQVRTQQDLRALTEQVRALADAQARTQQELQALADAQRRTEQVVRELVQTTGALKGENLERRYRERAASYFQRILRRIRVLDHQQLGLLLDDALDQGRITPDERAQVLEADVVVTGLADGREVYLLAEVSGTVTAHDVRRARARAEILEKATGSPVLPAVAGEQLSDDDKTQEEAPTVWRVLDGRVSPPGSP